MNEPDKPVASRERHVPFLELLALRRESAAEGGAVVASDAAADTSDQIFAVRNNEIFLISQPRPVRSVHRSEGWSRRR